MHWAKLSAFLLKRAESHSFLGMCCRGHRALSWVLVQPTWVLFPCSSRWGCIGRNGQAENYQTLSHVGMSANLQVFSKAQQHPSWDWAGISPGYQSWQAHDQETVEDFQADRDGRSHSESLGLDKGAYAVILINTFHIEIITNGVWPSVSEPWRPDFSRVLRTK